MVVVNLKRDWFGPNGTLYQVVDNSHEFPDSWELPASAEEVDSAKTVATLQNTANGNTVVVPTVVEDGVKSVGGALDDKGMEVVNQPVAKAETAADKLGVEAGGKPRESGPLPAGAKK